MERWHEPQVLEEKLQEVWKAQVPEDSQDMCKAQVPRELQEVWAAKQELIISHNGSRINFHGGGNRLWRPQHFTSDQLEKLTDAFVVSLLHDKVTSINVNLCMNLTDESIKVIAKRCPKLRELNASLSKLTDESMEAIAARCHELKDLDVSHIDNLTDESIKAIANGCTELRRLDISETKNLTDDSIKAISNTCPNLEELNAYNLSNLTDESIKAIAEGCPRLQQLNVGCVKNLTDESIKAIANGCHQLKKLKVSFVHALTDNSMKTIAFRCTELEELHVSSIKNITDESIKAIVESCTQLEELDASHCGLRSLPDDIGDRLQKLQSLDISYNYLTTLPPSIVKLEIKLNVDDNPLQSPPYEIAKRGLGAIERYFNELKKGSSVSKLLKVVLVGDGEAGKTTLRNALAARRNPRQTHRTIHLDIQKIKLTDYLDVNVYDCGGQEEYLATQLPYLTGMALYMMVVEAKYATGEDADVLEDKLHRFLVVLQNRVPGAVVLPIITKVDTVEDPESRCHWLESKIEKWLQGARNAVCGSLPKASADSLHLPALALVPDADDMRSAGDSDERHFKPLRVQFPAVAVSVADAEDEQAVRRSIEAVRARIIALTTHNPPLLRGIGQQIPSEYAAVLKLFGAIAECGDNNRALETLRNGKAHALGETSNELSPDGTYRQKDELENIWNTYRHEKNGTVEDEVFDDATQLWEAQGLIFIDAGLVFLQPHFITTIVKPLVDHRYDDEKECKLIKADVEQFINTCASYDNEDYKQLIRALDSFRDSGEIDTWTTHESLLYSLMIYFRHLAGLQIQGICESLLYSVMNIFRRLIGLQINGVRESLLLSFLWRDNGLEKRHYGPVLQMLATSGVIFIVDQDPGRNRIVVLFRLPEKPNEKIFRKSWPTTLPSKERELTIRFEPASGFPAGLAERFAADVRRLGVSLYSWKVGVVVRSCAGYVGLAEREGDALVLSVRFKAQSARAAWNALCYAQKVFSAQSLNRFPGLRYEEVIVCEQCRREGTKPLGTTVFCAKKTECFFRPCGHPFRLFVKRQEEKSVYINYQYKFEAPVSKAHFIGSVQGDAKYEAKSHSLQ